ncbi:MAG: SGNH/GDSL hydrolase family protein [Gemmatimonadales bacterium]
MEITAAELRCAWLVLACTFLATPLPGSTRAWAFALVLLGPGTWLLARSARASHTAKVLTETFSSRPARIAGIVIAGLIALAAWIFSVSAALAIVLVLATGCLFQALRRRPAGVQRLLVGALSVGTVVIVGGLLLEVLLGRVLAERVGAPSVRKEWARRYAELRKRHLFGFRSPYEHVVPAPGVTRVPALGDSYTWGERIARAEDTWPAQLERLLRDSLRTPVEVINTGRSGWTTVNEAELLRRFGWQWEPDLVVLQFTLNDVNESSPGFRDVEDPGLRLLPHRFRRGGIGRSTLLFPVETRLSKLINPYWGSTTPARYHPDSLAWQQTEAALREIADSAKARGVPVLLLIYPLLEPGAWTPETYPYRTMVDMVVTVGRKAGMEVVDLVSVYGAAGGDWRRWWASSYDPHPNPEGHALAARALAAHIRERGFLSRDRSARDTQPAVRPRSQQIAP